MHIQRIKVPGEDVVAHHMRTREGERLCLLVDERGNCRLFTYDEGDLDTPAWEIVLQPDEAGRLAEVLRNRPVKDRLHSLARRA